MEKTRKPRVPMSEQMKLINECRSSGMTDADWCREHGIAPSTFYNWVKRCREASAGKIAEPHYGHTEHPRPKQDVVPVDIVPDHFPEQTAAYRLPQAMNSNLDNSHTIEVVLPAMTIRINNEVDPALLTRTFRLLREISC